ncbi:glycosyltransferase [Yoonia sp.]|uniref:glycosyltransferase n=1 Tax=Yoonia sp. TaxID=2212373 RepID=UPI0025E442EF|nr:glycosyltransferase [Yoonia sp.]
MLRGSDAGAFPLDDLRDPFLWQRVPAGYPIIRPSAGLGRDTVETILASQPFLQSLQTLAPPVRDGGVCLDLTDYPNTPHVVLRRVLNALRAGLTGSGLETCLIGTAGAAFWTDAALVQDVDRAVAITFDPQPGPTSPTASQTRSENDIPRFNALVPAEKSILAIGGFGTAWRSGQRQSERIPFAMAMQRAAIHQGAITFQPDAGNTNIRYLDASRRINQIWLLDGISFASQRALAVAGQQVAVWPLGYEDPSIWTQLTAADQSRAGNSGIDGPLRFDNQLIVSGNGPFARLTAPQTDGLRQTDRDARDGRIVGQTYQSIPQPVTFSFFGAGGPGTLALSFNGLGDRTSTQKLFTLLADYGIETTFFASASDLLLSRDQLAQVLAHGHQIGTTSPQQTSRSWPTQIWSRITDNMAQSILAGELGIGAILVRTPALNGPLPVRETELNQLKSLLARGYIPVFASLPAAFGKIDTTRLVSDVRAAALARDINILSFDFSPQNAADVVAALPTILAALDRDGFAFRSVREIGGLDTVTIMPPANTLPPARDRFTYGFLGLSWIGVQGYILLLALIVTIRAPIYLVLALLRRPRTGIDPAFRPAVNIIVPAYNEEKVIARTITSILASHYDNFEITVVDDGSTDNTVAIIETLQKHHEKVNLLREENHGKWHAEDLAISRSSAPIFIIVDADTLLHPDAISMIVQPFQDPRVGAVAGTVEVGNAGNVLTVLQAIEYKISQILVRRAYETFGGILVVPGAIGAWRRAAVEKANYVSGETITEDADLTVAIHRAGYKVMYQEDARSYTEAPETLKDLMKQRFRWSYGMLQVAWKHRRSVLEGKVVGLVSITDALLLQLIGSLLYPVIDIILVITLFQFGSDLLMNGTAVIGNLSTIAIATYLALTLVDVFNLLSVFYFEKKWEWRLLLYIPLLRFGFRQLLYISSMRAIFRALVGGTSQWNKLNRTGTVTMELHSRTP